MRNLVIAGRYRRTIGVWLALIDGWFKRDLLGTDRAANTRVGLEGF